MKKISIVAIPLIILVITAGIQFIKQEKVIEKDIIYLTNGKSIIADEVWENNEIVYYKNNNKGDMLLAEEVDHIAINASHETSSYKKIIIQYYYEKKEQLFAFLELEKQKNNKSVSLIFFGFIKLLPDIIIFMLLIYAYKIFAMLLYKSQGFGKNKKNRLKNDINPFKINKQKLNEIEKIIYYFLGLYKKQLNVPEDAPANFYPAKGEQTGRNSIFELRVRQNKAWSKRRITIAQIGNESNSKSRCYYVIYDDHMVIKVPPEPVEDFSIYIGNIKKEKYISDILSPRECIIPMLSVIMKHIHSFPEQFPSTAEELEAKYIKLIERFPKYQEYLKIDGSFVYFMNLSKYFFLGHILKNMHDIKKKIDIEINEQPNVIWNLNEFESKYGIINIPVSSGSICSGIQNLYTKCEKEIKELTARHGLSSILEYQTQNWFSLYLSGNKISKIEEGLSPELTDDLNKLLKTTFEAEIKYVKAYRNVIKKYIRNISFFQNKLQIEGIISNMLDLLSWLREKGVAMRDLKPDNLIVAGEQANYPRFLRSPEEFSIGLIDVETSVFYKEKYDSEIAQPQIGGTPYYATPSQLLPNEVLITVFGNLPRILRLQDWFATVVIIFEVITGERLFEKSVKLFPVILKIITNSVDKKKTPSEIIFEISQLFWESAVPEFKEKIEKNRAILKRVNIIMVNQTRQMFCEEIKFAMNHIEKSIKDLIKSQNIIKSQKICNQLFLASSIQIRELELKFEKERWAENLDSKDKLKIKKLFQDLEYLKKESTEFLEIIKILQPNKIKISASVLLGSMFKIVYSCMFIEKYGYRNEDEIT